MGVPYVPVLGLAGSHLLRNREDMRLAPDPFRPALQTVVVRALRPDVALLHGLRADRAGNVQFGYESDNVLLAEASAQVIVTVEEVVDTLGEDERERTFLPGLLVDAVVEARYGAHPAGAPGAYPVDAEHMRFYVEQATSDEGFADYLAQTVFALAGHEAYRERWVPEGWGTAGQLTLRAAGD